MSRKNTKRMKNEAARRLAAAEAFVEQWTTSGRACDVAEHYTINCGDAETMADLFRTFMYPNTADAILSDHGEDCQTPHFHEKHSVWTFTFEMRAQGMSWDEAPSWTVVANGEDGEEAQRRAETKLREELKDEYKGYFWFGVEVETGIPSATALYGWLDAREYGEAA